LLLFCSVNIVTVKVSLFVKENNSYMYNYYLWYRSNPFYWFVLMLAHLAITVINYCNRDYLTFILPLYVILPLVQNLSLPPYKTNHVVFVSKYCHFQQYSHLSHYQNNNHIHNYNGVFIFFFYVTKKFKCLVKFNHLNCSM